MLPPPKQGKEQKISSAIRSDTTKIKMIPSDLLKWNEDDDEDEGNTDEKRNVVNVKTSDLVNKEEFYRNQLKQHSLLQFRDQTLARLKANSLSSDLVSKGKAKNQLASLGEEHMDMITRLQDNK